jgi:UDP:flavonoid glycosyltransferase YjiC (YdhE family)
MKILIASVGAPGHLNPLLAAASILSKKHEVAVQTSDELRPKVEAAGLRFIPEVSGAKTFVGTFMAEHPELWALPPGLERHANGLVHFFAAKIPVQAANLQHALHEFSADVILAGSFFFGTLPMLLGPSANRPAIVHLGISVLNAFSGKNVPRKRGVSDEEMRVEQELYEHIVLQPVQAAFNRSMHELGLDPLPYPALESMSILPDLYIHPGIKSFQYLGDSSAVHYIGRLPMPAGQAALPEWWDALDRTKRLVLVTQGTIANRDFGQLIGPALAGLATDQELIVLATTGGQPIESIPVEIPGNARVTEFLPYAQILPHVDLLITNGGYGTVNMALAEGIPIVSAGLTEDKELVSAHVQWAGVGIDLHTNQANPEMVRRAAREVLDNPSYRIRAKEMAREFASCNPEESLLALIESCVGETVRA